MIFRGIAARQLLSLTIFALSAAVVAGTVAAVGFSRLTSVSQGSSGALVLLGLVGLAGQSSESVRRRQHDLSLARLRGRRGLRLLYFAVAEPITVVVAGALVGVAAGLVAGRIAVATWLPASTTFDLSGDEWFAAGVVTAACVVVVLASSWQMLRSPLHAQLAAGQRPKRAGTLGLLLRLVLVLGAVVSIYQAHQDARSRVDWVSLVSPAVVGLAAAQILVWLLTAFCALVVPRSRGARFGWFLTLRRLLRRADSLALIRIVVAAGVVFGVAATASSASQGWREDRARLQVGAPVNYPIPGGALRAYALAHRADPEGRWLEPIAAYTTDKSEGARRVFVDTSRWKQVLGDFYDGSPAAPLTSALQRFPAEPAAVYRTGDSASLTIPSASVPGKNSFVVTLSYVDDRGEVSSIDIPVQAGLGTSKGSGLTTFTKTVRNCRLACSLVEVDINGHAAPVLHLVSMTFAGTDALGPGTGFQITQNGFQFLRISEAPGGGLLLRAGGVHSYFGSTVGTYEGGGSQIPAVATPKASFVESTGPPAVPGVDGADNPVRVVTRVPVLPFVGTRGSLVDIASVLRGASASIPSTQAAVLARADTPRSVIAALRSWGGVAAPHTYLGELRRLNQTSRAQGTRLYLVIAWFAAVIALIGLASGVAQQRAERRVEAASLRTAGVRTDAINKAYRTEVALLAVATLVGTAIACWITCQELIAALPLVSGWAFAPPLDSSPRWAWVGLSAGVSAFAVAGLGYLALHRIGRTSSPRMLREEIG